MGKVILEFDSIEEQEDIQTALDGYKWKLAMWDLDQHLRSTTKHGISILKPNTQASQEEYDTVDKIRQEIRNILSNYNIDFE
jgi:hypothetical protein